MLFPCRNGKDFCLFAIGKVWKRTERDLYYKAVQSLFEMELVEMDPNRIRWGRHRILQFLPDLFGERVESLWKGLFKAEDLHGAEIFLQELPLR